MYQNQVLIFLKCRDRSSTINHLLISSNIGGKHIIKLELHAYEWLIKTKNLVCNKKPKAQHKSLSGNIAIKIC